MAKFSTIGYGGEVITGRTWKRLINPVGATIAGVALAWVPCVLIAPSAAADEKTTDTATFNYYSTDPNFKEMEFASSTAVAISDFERAGADMERQGFVVNADLPPLGYHPDPPKGLVSLDEIRSRLGFETLSLVGTPLASAVVGVLFNDVDVDDTQRIHQLEYVSMFLNSTIWC